MLRLPTLAELALIISRSWRSGEMSRSAFHFLVWLAITCSSIGYVQGAQGCPSPSFDLARLTDLGWDRTTAVAGDFNGDGKTDVVITYDFDTYLLAGQGNGYFQPPVRVLTNTFKPLTVGDFNCDGISDFITFNYNVLPGGVTTAETTLLLGRHDGTFDQRTVNVPVTLSPNFPSVVADFNRDGKPDLAGQLPQTAGATPNLVVCLNNGDGSFGSPVAYPMIPSLSGIGLRAGDLNGDGALDLIGISINVMAQGPASVISVLINNGDGTFRPGPTQLAGVAFTGAFVAADFNRDGKVDLACAHYHPLGFRETTLAVFLGNGDGTFQPAVQFDTGIMPNTLFAGDFNGDGSIDLGARYDAGLISILLGNGDGTFRRPSFVMTDSATFPWVLVEDFNSDGVTDLAVGTRTGIAVFLNTCVSTTSSGPDLVIDRSSQSVIVSWPMSSGGLHLEAATSLNLPDWKAASGTVLTNNGRLQLETTADQPQLYFRLH